MTQHNEGRIQDLVHYRLENASSDLKSAMLLFNAGEYRSANNRAYYAAFHAINAVHALEGKGFKKHKDAIANFNKTYIKTEIFPRQLGHRIHEMEEIRHASDYDDFYVASSEEAEEQIETAKELINLIKKYVIKNS